jgi:hypothetical protein
MSWLYSNTSYPSTPSSYEWRGTNLYNQHCAAIGSIPAGATIRQLRVYAAARNNTVSTRLCLWSAGSSVLKQSSTFSMAVGSEAGGGQYWYTKDIDDYTFSSGGTLWVGLYRNPSGGHIFGRPSSPGASAYEKTNTSGFPNAYSMSGYHTDSGDEVTVGLFYIEAPAAVSSVNISRVSDTKQTLTWTNNNTTNEPYDSIKIYRYDNVTGSYYWKATLSGSATSYSDTSTVANRRYKYYIKAYNASGYSSAAYSDYIRTTPAAPSSVVATRVGSNVLITWNDNATAETSQTIYRNTSADGISWSGYALLDDTIATNTESYTDTSPANYNYYEVRADCTDPTLHSSFVESNEVIILQPPDAPTGLTPTDNTAIDGDDNNDFEWTHNSNDSTIQAKYSLKIKIADGTYPKEIYKVNEYTDWDYSGGVQPTNDTTNYVTGLTNSVALYDNDDTGNTYYMYRAGLDSMDLTEFDDESASDTSDLISFLVYITDKTLFSDVTLKLGDDNSNCYETSKDPSTDLVDGWNRIDIAKSAFSTTGSPSGWDDITFIRFEITSENNASAEHISLQYIQLAKVTNFTSYAGTKFVQFHEISDTDELLSLDGDSLVNGYSFDWQVKTWGQATTGGTFSDGSSDYSDTSTFVASNTPVATITDPTAISNYAYSELEVDWTYTQANSSNQVEFLCYLYDSNDTLLETQQESTNVATGGTDTATFETALENNSTYTIILMVKSAAGLWSVENEIEFDTVFLEPTTPTISVVADNDIGGTNITITNPDIEVVYSIDSDQDTYINSDESSSNYNGNGHLSLKDDSAGGTEIDIILLDFDLSEFADDTIVSADLFLYREYALTPGIDSAVKYITTSWDETTVTYATKPTLNGTAYDDHTHAAGDSETWDVKTLVEDILDGTITDYEGMAVVATTTDGSADYFYDSTITNYEPELIIEIEPRNAELDYNKVYRSVAGGAWELVDTNIPGNTTITDYVPNVGGNTNYYAEAVSILPSSALSTEVDIDIELTGYYFINGGNNYEDYAKLSGDIFINELRERDTAIKKYHNREFPVKYQSVNKTRTIKFECDLLKINYDDLFDIIETVGNHMFRDWNGRYFTVAIKNPRVISKDNKGYQFSCDLERVYGG